MLKHLLLEPASQTTTQPIDVTTLSSYWAHLEFAQVDLGDKRLNRRLRHLATDFGKAPSAAIPQACGEWAPCKGAYRFFSNPRVDYTKILASHQQQTLERAGSHRVVLCPQDTTSLNYTPHSLTQGLGPIGNKLHTPIGFFVHATVALSEAGDFLGVLDAQIWARPKKKTKRSKVHRNRKTIQEKESHRWLQSFRKLQQLSLNLPTVQLVSVGDREADIYELLQLALAADNSVGLVVRVQHDREVVAKEKNLKKHLGAKEVAGTMTVEVPRQGNQPARLALLAVRYGAISLCPPSLKKKNQPLPLWALMTEEIDPPKGIQPIRWFLLSSLPIRTLADAQRIVGWYAKRWIIEEFHRVLKSGCNVEHRQLETRERLVRALSVDMVVAWRVLSLTKAARLHPCQPASLWLSEPEWQSLSCYCNKTPLPIDHPPEIRQAVRWIASLGGFLGRKGDGEPGPTTLWRGLTRLSDIATSWERFRENQSESPKRCG